VRRILDWIAVRVLRLILPYVADRLTRRVVEDLGPVYSHLLRIKGAINDRIELRHGQKIPREIDDF
jgi:hypothetical protein